jgi:hypothetical protein
MSYSFRSQISDLLFCLLKPGIQNFIANWIIKYFLCIEYLLACDRNLDF